MEFKKNLLYGGKKLMIMRIFSNCRNLKKIYFIICLSGIKFIVTGEFNFHVDNKNNAESKRFLNLLEEYVLVNWIPFQTHILFRSLDLIITKSSNSLFSIKHIEPRSYIYDHRYS